MRRKYLLILALLAATTGSVLAQDARAISRKAAAERVSFSDWYMNRLMLETGNFVGPMPVAPATPANDENSGGALGKTDAFTIINIGEASNAYTILRTSQNQVVAKDGIGTGFVGFIHRQNIDNTGSGGAPPTTANGVSRIGFSLDGGATVRKNAGPLNPVPYPNTARGRYPQVALINPNNTTNIDDQIFGWVSPCTDGTNWGNYSWGSAKSLDADLWINNDTPIDAGPYNSLPQNVKDAIKFGFLGNDQNSGVLLPGGLCKSDENTLWMVDIAFRPGVTLDSLMLFRGVYNSGTGFVDYAFYKALRPKLRLRDDNGQPQFIGTPNMAFSPDGQHGWVAMFGCLDDPTHPNDAGLNPIFFKTEDGGQTWSEPINVFINDYSAITDSLYRLYKGTTEGGADTSFTSSGLGLVLDGDIVVDNNGNPHYFASIVNSGDSTYHNGKVIQDDHDGYSFTFSPGLQKILVDITTYDGGKTWTPKVISEAAKYQGSVPGSTLGFGVYPQVSMTEDGTRIFYSWADDTVSTRDANSMQPGLWGRAMEVSTEKMTDLKNPSEASNTYRSRIFFPTCAPTVLTPSAGTYRQPTVFMELKENSDILPCNFYLVRDRQYVNADFTAPTTDVAINSLPSAPGQNLCAFGLQPVTVSVTNTGTVAVDSISVTYVLNGDFSTRRTIYRKLGSPLAPSASTTVTFDATNGENDNGVVDGRANFNKTGNYELFVAASCHLDGKVQNNYKYMTIVVNGGSSNIITDNAVSGCGSVTLATGLVSQGSNTITTTWQVDAGGNNYVEVTNAASPIKDDVTISNNGQTLVYAPPASTTAYNYAIRVLVNSTTCGNSTDDVNITINPQPAILPGGAVAKVVDKDGNTVAPVPNSSKYQVCGTNGNFITFIPADTVATANLEVTWKKGIGRNATTFANTNKVKITASDRYTVTVRNSVTGCEVEKSYDVRVWNINLSFSGVSANQCFWRKDGDGDYYTSLALEAANASTGNFGDVRYDWKVTSVASPHFATQFPGDNNRAVNNNISPAGQIGEDTIVVRSSNSSSYGMIWPNTTENVFLNTRTATYQVTAMPEDNATLNCTAANATATITISVFDSTDYGFTHNLNQNLQIYRDNFVVLTDTTKAGLTPITHRYWRLLPNNSQLQLDAGSTLGNTTTQGSTTLRFKWGGTGGSRRAELITCSALPGTSQPQLNGCCDTTILIFTTTNVNSRSELNDFSSNVQVYPNPTVASFEVSTYFNTATVLKLELVDLRGSVINSEEILTSAGDFARTLDLEGMPAGIYLVKMTTPDGVALKKIVKQ